MITKKVNVNTPHHHFNFKSLAALRRCPSCAMIFVQIRSHPGTLREWEIHFPRVRIKQCGAKDFTSIKYSEECTRISIVRVGCHFCVFPSPVSTHAAPPHARKVNAHHEFTFKSHVLVTEQITAGLTRGWPLILPLSGYRTERFGSRPPGLVAE